MTGERLDRGSVGFCSNGLFVSSDAAPRLLEENQRYLSQLTSLMQEAADDQARSIVVSFTPVTTSNPTEPPSLTSGFLPSGRRLELDQIRHFSHQVKEAKCVRRTLSNTKDCGGFGPDRTESCLFSRTPSCGSSSSHLLLTNLIILSKL